MHCQFDSETAENRKMATDAKTTELIPALDHTFTPLRGDTAEAELCIHTYKYGGVLKTVARVQYHNGGFTTTRYGHDFNRTYSASNARATQKAIDAQHANVLLMLDDIRREALEHYGVEA